MENKNNKGNVLVVLVIVLLISTLALSGFIVYDKFIKEDEVVENNGGNKEEDKNVIEEPKEDKNESVVVDITNSDIVKKLHASLITKNKTYGLYFEDKISVNDTTNEKLLRFNFINYYFDNNLKVNCCGGEVLEYSTMISKSNFNSYMNKKYNNDLNYYLETGKTTGLFKQYTVTSYENEYGYYGVAKGSGTTIVENKLLKAEQQGEYIYIYDNATSCTSEGDRALCRSVVNDSMLTTDAVYMCLTDLEGNTICDNEEGPGRDNFEKFSSYVLNNLSDELNTFKHTFKKANDGNYYWISSEISK